MAKMTREEFLVRRKSGIGGSDVAAVMGLSKYRTPYDVWRDKTSDVVIEQQSDILALSSYLEDYTAQKYAELTGYKVRRRNAEIKHPKYSFLKGNIDREICLCSSGAGILECKALSNFNFKRVEMYGLPDEYILQLQYYFLCGNGKYLWGAFAVLNRDNGKLLTFPVTPDHQLGKMIEEKCVAFWNDYVLTETPPPENDAKAVSSESIPKIEGSVTDMNDDTELASLLKQRGEMKSLCDETKELLNNVEEKIKDKLGDIEAAECSGFRVYFKGSKRTTLDSAKIKKELPDIFEKYSKTSETGRSLKFYTI